MYQKKTTKLFFNKYVYKVAVRTPLSTLFRGKNLPNTRQQIEVLSERFDNKRVSSTSITNGWRSRQQATSTDVFVGLLLLDQLDSLSDFTLRVENSTLGLYCNDLDFISKVTNIVGINVEEIAVPETDDVREFLLSNPKSIIRGEYTHKYKVTVNALWESADNFKAWAVKLPKIKTTNNKYRFGGHFYVADEKTLSLCHIFLADKIRKVEQLVTTTEI
jgi:hypothetical protein